MGLIQLLDSPALSTNNEYSLLFDPTSYHRSSEKFGTFSFLMLSPGQRIFDKDGEKKQFSFPLRELPERIPEFVSRAFAEKKHLFISQSSFRGFNRQRANFLASGCLFVDLDTYSSSYARSLTTNQLINAVYQVCETFDIPEPSVIINSGRGLYLKWFIEHIGSYAVNYWELIQTRLFEIFQLLGADANAKDVSRVLRVVGTENIKYREKPLCEIINVKWDDIDVVAKCELSAFQTLLPHSLQDAQEFKLRMQECNAEYKKNGRTIRQEKSQRLVIFECLKELHQGNLDQDLTPAKLHDYIKTTRQLTRFSMPACQKYLQLWQQQAEHYKLTGESFAKSGDSTKRVYGSVISSASAFNLKRRNWSIYQDILAIAEHRYGSEGVEDGLRDAFYYVACNMFALSEFSRKSISEIKTEWGAISELLVPSWDEKRIRSSLHSVSDRLEKTVNKEECKGNWRKNGVHLYVFSDKKIHELLQITNEELQLVNPNGTPLIREVLGEDERNRRDPLRLEKQAQAHRNRDTVRRRATGSVSREAYLNDANAKSQSLAEQVRHLLDKGMKGKEIAVQLGITAARVSQLKKN